jgi:hypothetical protein
VAREGTLVCERFRHDQMGDDGSRFFFEEKEWRVEQGGSWFFATSLGQFGCQNAEVMWGTFSLTSPANKIPSRGVGITPKCRKNVAC